MKNIHILPTDKPSRLIKNNLGLIRVTDNFTQSDLDFIQAEFVNIYITSDEEIKEGDWCLCSEELIHKVVEIKSNIGIIRFQDGVTEVLDACKKIILTTDQDLIGVQAIDDEFLEWFVKNPSCEEVEVERMFNVVQFTSREFIYKIIIPKEETKQETLLGKTISKEVADKDSFEDVTKYKRERSYSEEEVLVLLHKRDAYNFKNYAQSLLDWKTPKEWFESFKNK